MIKIQVDLATLAVAHFGAAWAQAAEGDRLDGAQIEIELARVTTQVHGMPRAIDCAWTNFQILIA